MPTVPNRRKCQSLGCKNEKAKFGGYCIHHGGTNTFPSKKYNLAYGRKEAIARYQSKHWRQLRQIQLSTHPMCAGCLSAGIITPAEQVDHLFPWQQINEQAFFRNIFQSLCLECHSSKTGMEKAGVFRLYGKPSIDYRIGDYQYVVMTDALAHDVDSQSH
jgi:5-methylcytosine-specific restriction protein A